MENKYQVVKIRHGMYIILQILKIFNKVQKHVGSSNTAYAKIHYLSSLNLLRLHCYYPLFIHMPRTEMSDFFWPIICLQSVSSLLLVLYSITYYYYDMSPIVFEVWWFYIQCQLLDIWSIFSPFPAPPAPFCTWHTLFMSQVPEQIYPVLWKSPLYPTSPITRTYLLW